MSSSARTKRENTFTRRNLLKSAGVATLAGVTGGLAVVRMRNLRAEEQPAPKQDDTPVDKLSGKTITLPKPMLKGTVSVEEAIQARRSRREYKAKHITASQLSQLLWCAQGITKRQGRWSFRAAPSAGALYPMDVFAVLPSGVYRYKPAGHQLEQIAEGDRRKQLEAACLGQGMVTAASVNLVITATYETCAAKYGGRAERYCIIESGCISENIHIQCEALRLGTVIIGAFTDADVSSSLSLPKECKPLIVMPVGPV